MWVVPLLKTLETWRLWHDIGASVLADAPSPSCALTAWSSLEIPSEEYQDPVLAQSWHGLVLLALTYTSSSCSCSFPLNPSCGESRLLWDERNSFPSAWLGRKQSLLFFIIIIQYFNMVWESFKFGNVLQTLTNLLNAQQSVLALLIALKVEIIGWCYPRLMWVDIYYWRMSMNLSKSWALFTGEGCLFMQVFCNVS